MAVVAISLNIDVVQEGRGSFGDLKGTDAVLSTSVEEVTLKRSRRAGRGEEGAGDRSAGGPGLEIKKARIARIGLNADERNAAIALVCNREDEESVVRSRDLIAGIHQGFRSRRSTVKSEPAATHAMPSWPVVGRVRDELSRPWVSYPLCRRAGAFATA